MKITDNLSSGRTLSFGYDALSRVTSAATQATSGADCWGQQYTYDDWGNLTNETGTQCSAPQLSVGATANNQLSATGVTYDGAGNTSSDGTCPQSGHAGREGGDEAQRQ